MLNLKLMICIVFGSKYEPLVSSVTFILMIPCFLLMLALTDFRNGFSRMIEVSVEGPFQ
jgi:hypothetical protein